ncbi:pyruvate, water dikinase [Natronincola peptidivorans]|uniref:Pyruvate, water dikinase n=1 Tax=Natronincola peptidivorans TaxID=426128 RepID=A0A1I0DR98_9FIRM|nr:PEP/pyruvate-binding domain-containing protein [Natronincola peptidivorans]SET35085.1 pyruvate, water dikinase [Natronincola peptidivorans]
MKSYYFVRPLEDVGKGDIPLAGGKGANLGEMIKAGFPVPDGFVLLVNAYEKFVEANNLEKDIENLLSTIGDDYTADLEKASIKVKSLFEKGEIPKIIKKEIDEIYREIGEPHVAVRSSATAEDLPGASFAGQYSTFLNIKGKEELYAAIKKCWASLWNDRAVFYRGKHNISNEDISHGVVVQRLINSEKSGILFTANPVNGRRDEISLNSSWGLGEAIVSGEVDPDQWIIHKKTGRIVSEHIAVKKVMTVRRQQGIDLVRVEEKKQEEVTLNESERRELLDLAIKVEEHYGAPQDIEWAYENKKFYLVQTRPITTLYPIPEPKDTGEELRIYMNLLMWRQGMSDPITPMGVDFFSTAVKNVIVKKKRRPQVRWLKRSGGRIFIDITEALKFEEVLSRLRENKIPALFDSEPITFKALSQVGDRYHAELKKSRKSVTSLLLGIIASLGFGIIKMKMFGRFRELYSKMSPRRAVYKATKFGHNKIAALKEGKKRLQTAEEKLAFVEQEAATVFFGIGYGMIFWLFPPINALAEAIKIIDKHMDTSSEKGEGITDLEKVKRAVHNCVTTEMGMEMLQIAKKLDETGEEPSPEHPELQRFLLKYGHRGTEEIDIGLPRWNEDPIYVINLIRSYIEHKAYQEGIQRFYLDREEAEEALTKIVTGLKDKGAYRDAKKVENLLRLHREMFGYRELPKSILVKGIGILREVLVEIGEELEAEGRLDDKNDVFYVTFEDIRSGLKLQEKVWKNREEFQREQLRTFAPRVITSTGETIYSAVEEESGDGYRGIPASPGVWESQVKILKRPEEGHKLSKGDILVTASTNPAWTPLFLRIGGLIMETGAPMSHGPVVAREYGIPAIIGVKDATTALKDDQIVRMNGETGKIEVI